MVERLHRQLKAALTAHLNRDRWTDHLPIVLLGLRSSLKQDLGCTTAELVYGAPLCLPGDFFLTTNDRTPLDPADYLRSLRKLFRTLRPVPPR